MTEPRLDMDMVTQAGLKNFKCDLCGKFLSESAALKNHVKWHLGIRPHQCNVCQKSFVKKSHLNTHLNSHVKNLICNECNRSFPSLLLLKRHESKHKIPDLTCKLCGKKCSSDSNKNTHMILVHTEEDMKKFKCTLCNKAFLRKCDLNSHLRGCGKTKLEASGPLKCKLCCRSFKRQDTLDVHERTHGEKAFKCRFCNYCSDRKESVNSHERTHTGEKPFDCHICSNKFSSSKARDIHILSHTGEMPFSCIICEKKFRQRPNLNTHMKSAHPASTPALFSCNICEKTFSTKQSLGTHKSVHSNENTFQCSVCSKRLNFRQNLRVHTKTHSNIRAEVFCVICSKYFDKAVIKKHKQEVHYDIRTHKCSTCDQRFHRYADMKIHMDRKH